MVDKFHFSFFIFYKNVYHSIYIYVTYHNISKDLLQFIFWNRIRWKVESGLRLETMFFLTSGVVEQRVGAMDCLSESVNTKSYDPEFKSMSVKYFITCFNGLYVLLFTAFIILVGEIINKCIGSFQPKKQMEYFIAKGSFRPKSVPIRHVSLQRNIVS